MQSPGPPAPRQSVQLASQRVGRRGSGTEEGGGRFFWVFVCLFFCFFGFLLVFVVGFWFFFGCFDFFSVFLVFYWLSLFAFVLSPFVGLFVFCLVVFLGFSGFFRLFAFEFSWCFW